MRHRGSLTAHNDRDIAACPTGATTWLGKKHNGASQSFTESEIGWLDSVLSTLRRGGDTRVLARSKDLRAVAQKVHTMKASAARNKANE